MSKNGESRFLRCGEITFDLLHVVTFPFGEGGPLAVDEVSRGKVTLIAQHLIRQPNGCHLPPLGKAWVTAHRSFPAPNTVCGDRLDGRLAPSVYKTTFDLLQMR